MLRRLFALLRSTAAYTAERPARLVGVGVALLAGSIAGIPVQERIYDYTWADADFCDDCHVHDYANEAWARSVHAGFTTCHDCHLVPIRHYPRNLWNTMMNPPESAEDITVPDVATLICTRCHSEAADHHPLTGPMSEEVRAQVVKIDDSPLHRLHMSSETRQPHAYQGGEHEGAHESEHEGEAHDDHHEDGDHTAHAPIVPHGVNQPSWDAGVITCMDCHGAGPNRAHRFEATRENCVTCHETLKVHGSRLDGLDCRSCHFGGFVGRPGQGDGAAAPHP